MAGEFSKWLDHYADRNQLAVDSHFRALTALRAERSGDDEGVPITDYEERIASHRASIADHATRVMGEGVAFPPNAFYLLTGDTRNPQEVVRTVHEKYDGDTDGPPREALHLWSMASLVVLHTVDQK